MTLKTEKVHKSLDFQDVGLLLNWGLQVLTSDPATTYARVYFNSVSGKLRLYNTDSSAWEDVGGGGSSYTVDDSTIEAPSNVLQLKDGGTTNAKLANMAAATIKGRASGAGTGAPSDLTAAQVKTILAITPSDISGFDTQVRTSRVDQMATPGADWSNGGFKITSVGTPTSANDAANKAYVDATAAGIDWKASVRVATTAAGTLASSFENGDTVDGVTLATGDRILIKDQASGAENGIYTVNASGAPTRATDADTSAEMTSGVAVFVEEGTTNADTGWVLTTNNPITLGSTALTFAQFTSLGQVTAGAGLTKTGSTLNVGQGTGITVNADDVAVDTSVVVRKYVSDIGDGATADIVVTHNLGTRDVQVTVRNASSPFEVQDVYWEATSTNTITIFFPTAPASAAYRVIVHA